MRELLLENPAHKTSKTREFFRMFRTKSSIISIPNVEPKIPFSEWKILEPNLESNLKSNLESRVYNNLKINLKKIILFQPTEAGDHINLQNLEKKLEERSYLTLSANVLDYLLEHKELIPKEWKEKRIVFLGTIYSGPNNQKIYRFLEDFNGQFLDGH